MILGLSARHHSLMVLEYQMLGDASTAAVIPLQGFLPVDGVGWWHVGSNALEDVTISSWNGGGHNGHGESGEYAVRRGYKSTPGWRLPAVSSLILESV
jgi:hypothetical protein